MGVKALVSGQPALLCPRPCTTTKLLRTTPRATAAAAASSSSPATTNTTRRWGTTTIQPVASKDFARRRVTSLQNPPPPLRALSQSQPQDDAASTSSLAANAKDALVFHYSQKRFLDTSKGLKRFSMTTSSQFGRPGVSLNDQDLVKDKLLIDCGEDQDCVLDGIVALGKFDALHIGHRELAMHASKSGNPFLLSFVGMAEVLCWEDRPPIVAHCDRKRVLSSWAPYCRNVVPLEYQVEFSKVRYLTPRQFVEKLSTDLRIKGVVAGENYRFGYKASGDAAELVKLCEEFGLSAFIVRSVMDTAKRSYNGATPAVNSNDKGQVSSSRVRHALSVGDMEYVSKLLGRKHRLVLTVSEYSLKERKNIIVPKSCMLNMPPADGFYENCELFSGGYLGLCRVVINTGTIDIKMNDESSLPPNPFQEGQQLGIEFG